MPLTVVENNAAVKNNFSFAEDDQELLSGPRSTEKNNYADNEMMTFR